MLSERGSIAVDERTNTLIITDIHQNLICLEKMIKKLDIEISEEVQIKAEKVKIPTITKMVNLKYAKAEEIKKTLDELKSEKGKIIINEKANAVIVTDTPVNVEKVMEYLMKLDVKPRQVMINAKIVEVTLKKDDALGIDWQKFSFQAWKEGSPAEAYTGNIKTDFSLETAGLTLNIFNQDTDVILNALAKRTKINLLSDPKIVTLNNVEAYIKVGQEIPIPTIETTALGTRTTYTFKDAVIKLTVTPQISEDNYIRIKVRPEIKSVSGYTKAEEAKDQQPIFSTREAETEVLVKDGQTIIIGGLIKELETKEVSRVPFLGKIPILGLLFRGVKSPEAGNEKIELLVFITPHILKEEVKSEGVDLAEEKREKMDLSAGQAGGSTYTLQVVGAYCEKENARKLMEDLQKKGYKPYLTQLSDHKSPGKMLYRVRLGIFKTEEEAEQFAQEIKKKEDIPLVMFKDEGSVEELVREIKEKEIKEEKSRRRKRWERRKQAN